MAGDTTTQALQNSVTLTVTDEDGVRRSGATTAEITATPDAPARITSGALSAVMPPMAMMGIRQRMATSWARSIFVMVSGHQEPAFVAHTGALCEERLGDIERAIRLHRRALELDPQLAASQEALVDLEFHNGPAPADPMAKQAEILSADLRWDWFFGLGEVLSLSLFQKNIQNPVEQVFLAAASDRANR